MHPTILATSFELSPLTIAMCAAGIVLFLIGVWAAKNEIAGARGLDKIVALSNVCIECDAASAIIASSYCRDVDVCGIDELWPGCRKPACRTTGDSCFY
jgi:hypothetical protein